MQTNIEQIINNFFSAFSLDIKSIKTTIDEKNNINIKIQTSDSALFIGSHGKNLEAIENVLRTIINKNLDSKNRLHIEINDYVNNKDSKLFSMLKEKVALVKKTGQDIKLAKLNPYERKKAHSFIADLKDDTIYTKSIGEGDERRLHICKLNPKMTIDIDSNDI